MNLIIVYKEDYPWDVRVEKLARALLESGHTVTILARNLNQNPVDERVDGLQVRRLPRTGQWPRVLQKLANLPLWFNPFWLYAILRAIRGIPQPVVIVRDLPLVRSATLIALFRQMKVVFDMAEVYPEMYRSVAEHSDQVWLRRAAKSPSLAARQEQAVLPRVDHVLVMIEESRDRLLAMGVPPEKTTIVSNTPAIEKFDGHRHEHTGETLRIVYVGFLSKLRGLDLLIEAVARYISNGNAPTSIQVDIVGKGASKERLASLIKSLGVEQSVRLHGWLEQDQVNRLMANANIGALTYRVCGHWNHTIPNKIFDYMLAGLPVLATGVLPIRRIVESADCGLVCRDQDPADIAEKLEQLKSPALRQTLGGNGHQAVLKTYNWETDRARLNNALLSLPGKSPARVSME